MGLPAYPHDLKPQVVTGADPAAGTEISVTVPDGEVWELLSIRFQFITSAVANNRRVLLSLTDGTDEFSFTAAPGTQAQSKTFEYSFTSYGANVDGGADDVISAPLGSRPPVLRAGDVIRTVTKRKDAGDNFSAPVLYVVKYVSD